MPAQRFLHSDSIGAPAVPPITTPTRMDFFKLQDRFWQLDAEQSFSPAETRLYMYWLNRFNKEFWPASLPRTVKQVAADLGMDDKTIDKARKGIEERGLITYQAGNKKVSALWFLPAQVDRKNSGQSAKNSPQIDRNFSGANEGNPGNSPQMDRKNSAPYKEENKNSSVVKQNEEEGAAPLPSSATQLEEKVTPQPASQNPVPQNTQGGGAAAPAEPRKLPFRESKYATAEGLAELARNLSFGKACIPYYLRQITSKAEDLPDRVEVGQTSWKVFAQNYLTNDAHDPRRGLITRDPMGSEANKQSSAGRDYAAQQQQQLQKDYL